MFAHLHTRSWFSFLAGASAPESLAETAAQLGVKAVALTDVGGVYGVVRFQKACARVGIKSLFGAEVNVDGFNLVLLAESHKGYANLCMLLTAAHLRQRLDHLATIEEVARYATDLHCLTGTWGSRLWHLLDSNRLEEAQVWIQQLHRIFGQRLSIEMAHHLRPGDTRRLAQLSRLSELTYVPLVATGDVRHASASDYKRYDLLTCIRLGITVFDSHEDRPRNSEACMKSEDRLRKLIPYPHAFLRAEEIAEACTVNLLPGHITPPAARIPPPHTARSFLHRKCEAAFARRYAARNRSRAREQLDKELQIIGRLDLEEFFLVVAEIVDESRRRGIRCAGRGSAANSIVAYLLGITGVCPIDQNLLFERFLHTGRKGTPDIDVDFDSDRRDEIIDWMEKRFGIEQTAMTATIITYRIRSAIRDTAKALGWPMDQVNRLSKAVSPYGSNLADYRVRLEQIVGPSPLFDVLLTMAGDLAGCPRHLGLHSGGMVLSRKPLHNFTPIQVSANGVKVTTFDKDDVEALGLIKFDVLGLRMLAALSEAVELIQRHARPDSTDAAMDIDELPLDDIPTFNMIRASKTLGVFQIESQGQLHLLGQHQPENFMDLINEIALFRPGPLQSGMVHPFVRRRRKLEPITYPHPLLEPVLKDTLGVIIYQEQVLEVAHRFAGMPLEEADEFRRLMSKFRDPGQMEGMRTSFVDGAMRKGISHETATQVFDIVSKFVGYGFCRSHAAAFAKTVYQSAYLKRHHTAAFMAAFMQHRPGFYSLMTIEEEARRFGVETYPPDINVSGVRYDLERINGKPAIRKPLTSIRGLSTDAARLIVWERLQKPFSSTEDLFRRVPIHLDALNNIARAGAMDSIASSSRTALWEIGLLQKRLGEPGRKQTPALFDLPAFDLSDIPDLPTLSMEDRLSWDYETHGAARIHPMALVRRTLNDLEIRPISLCYRLGRTVPVGTHNEAPTIVTIAGIAALRQRPATANGVLFLTLEDETGLIQTIVLPKTIEHLDHVLGQSALIARGKLQVMGNWRGLVLTQAWPLNGILGGYEGHLSMAGGRDRLVTRPDEKQLDTNLPDLARIVENQPNQAL